MIAGLEIPYGKNEFEAAGGLIGEAVEVIAGPRTGLPIPAHAEIAFEGFIHPNDVLDEGPLGEWTGYYAGGLKKEPAIRIETVMHRHDPILLGAIHWFAVHGLESGRPPGKPGGLSFGPAWVWGLVAALPFRKRAFGNRVVVVIVVGIVGVVMQRAYRGRRDPLLQFFHVQQNLVFHLVSPPFCFWNEICR